MLVGASICDTIGLLVSKEETRMLIFTAVCLIIVGLAVGLLGYKLFRVLLPLAGLVAGAVIGFSGFQGLFGSGVVSTTISILVAIVFGLVLGLLAYLFFEVALVVFSGLVFSSLFVFLAVALGLSANGVIVTLLSIAGFVVGLVLASSTVLLGERIVTFVTAFIGVGLMLAGVFLLSGGVSLQELQTNGIIASVANKVDKSFLWLFIWVAVAIIFRYIQMSTLLAELFPKSLEYQPSKK